LLLGSKFINNLDSNIISKTVIRPYPPKIEWDQDKIYNDNFKSIKIEKITTDINESMSKARLVLCTWNSTNFLNLLYSNIPTVCFWDQNLFEIEKTAQPLINQLYKTKVLHKDYQSASLFINKNWEKIDNWWYSSQTQQSIKNFIDNYAINQKSANNIFENSFRG